MTEQQRLMRKFQMYHFCELEAALFLDTHTDDKEAIDYYNRCKKLSENAMKEYEERFGPISMPDMETSGEWKWATDRWPWEVDE